MVTTAPFGAFIDVGGGFTGLLHRDEMKLPEGTQDWYTVIREGEDVEVRVVNVSRDKVQLSQRSAAEVEELAKFQAEGLAAPAADLPEDAPAMARLMARAGISASSFQSVSK